VSNYEDVLPIERIATRLVEATGDERWREPLVELIAGGTSKLTFELSSAAGSLILRRPPSGVLLPSAHDMMREARVQGALAQTSVSVAPIVLVEDSVDLIGARFYVMEKVDGLVIRDEVPAGYADSAADRIAMADALVDTLVELHAVDPAAVGLADYGRPDGYLARQVRRWSDQWQRSKTHDVAPVKELARRLATVEFASPGPAIVHGDYRLDNCLMDVASPARVTAVLDWELSTLGDPLADLGMLLFYWCGAGESAPVLTSAVTAEAGFPDRAHLAQRYAERSGVDLEALSWYVAFSHFKFAVIAQGIAARVAAGSMAGQSFGDLDDEVFRIAADGLDRLND
jgi:aminoglycoside phosphotransferase (APT) family kinase protein